MIGVQRRKRDHANGVVSRAKRALALAEARAREASAFGRSLVADVNQKTWPGGEFAQRAALMTRAARDSQEAAEHASECVEDVSKAHAEAFRAERKLRTLEKVEERLAAHRLQEERRLDQRETDEVAGRRRR